MSWLQQTATLPIGGNFTQKQCDCVPEKRLFNCDKSPQIREFAKAMMTQTFATILLCITLLTNLQPVHCATTTGGIIIDQGAFSGAQLLPTPSGSHAALPRPLAGHLQPVSVFSTAAAATATSSNNRRSLALTSINLTHLTLDEFTNSVYVGATNWLFQLSGSSLRPEIVLRTGPANPTLATDAQLRDCAPADCVAPLAQVEPATLPLYHAHPASELGVAAPRRPTPITMHTTQQQHNLTIVPTKKSIISSSSTQQTATQQQQQQQHLHNNYNKILLIEPEAKQLLVCGSLSQGACRKHQLGQVSNYSDLVPLPVASNDELSSSIALITQQQQQQQQFQQRRQLSNNNQQQPPMLYVAATNSRIGPYRDMVPPISARYLDDLPAGSRSMQIIERSFAESARLDISSELRDYYLVNYVHTFQHSDYVYFATVQRKSPLRSLEEWGYITRLARLCLSDLSFQSYTEMTLECRTNSGGSEQQQQQQQQQKQVNYNLLQDAQLVFASSHLAQQLNVRLNSAVLIGAFAQSRDHTTKTTQKSAICLFPMEKIEQRFMENIHLCYNGTARARNMNYIAGAVNDCPKLGKAGNVANFCTEPLKLNGSLPLTSSPVLSYDDQLISALVATQANTAPISGTTTTTLIQEQRSHQVLVLGTGEGWLRRVALLSGSGNSVLRAHELDAVQISSSSSAASTISSEEHQSPAAAEPVLADLLLQPAVAPIEGAQFALAATQHKLVRLRINGCRASTLRNSPAQQQQRNQSHLSLADDCNACAQLQDPFCGWCATSGSCSTRDECKAAAPTTNPSLSSNQQQPHWTPFDQVQCTHYQPVWPQFVALQASRQVSVDVNVPLAQAQQAAAAQLGLQLAQTHFVCHFEYLPATAIAYNNQSRRSISMRATQVRLNAHLASVAITCPLPPQHQRPSSAQLSPHDPPADQVRTRLSVRLAANEQQQQQPMVSANNQLVAQALGLRTSNTIERELSLYDCAAHTTCRTCLNSAHTGNSTRGYTCAWCPLSAKCTFDASDAELGCAAAAVSSTTTPHSASSVVGLNGVRASHLTSSLNHLQASVFGIALHQPAQCPAEELAAATASSIIQQQIERPVAIKSASQQSLEGEILVPSGARRAIQVTLRQQLLPGRQRKLECLFELEGAKARVSARLISESSSNIVVCQETLLAYQEEVATQRAQLSILLNEQQVIETNEVILYKCHLFGVSPPALTSSGGLQHSSAAWRAHELFQLVTTHQQQQQPALSVATSGSPKRRHAPLASDCSLCLNVERKYQCQWCNNQCLQSEQCVAGNHQLSTTCPPPRIDSIYPTSGPLEGGTLLTIEGSNLGSNEREIQDKISVGGEACQLVMYSVSTRIVCKTGASLHGPQAATVFVGNRAGVTSAQEKFHYKAVHLTDVKPNIGPVSGGTRLTLSGSNLNVGSRVQVFLDDIPCALDSNLASSNQITCVTAPNLLASSMRITRLTLMLDNSTHHLPYPFTYQPDPIIMSIEPVESFVSGGRLIVISGQHLHSPQSVKLMVYHEQRHSLINGTSCITHNDTHIVCYTPALPELLALTSTNSLTDQANNNNNYQDNAYLDSSLVQQSTNSALGNPLSRKVGGVKLKMSFFMDDVRSVRNLDEYYHHLPHYLTYYEDPRLFRLSSTSTPSSVVVDYTPELVISGENLDWPDLDQDIQISIGQQKCLIKSYNANQVVCIPPVQVISLSIEQPLILPITANIGTNIKYDIGYMQYSSNNIIRATNFPPLPHQENDLSNANSILSFASSYPSNLVNSYQYNQGSRSEPSTSSSSSSTSTTNSGVAILVSLSIIGFFAGFVATLMFALSRFRQSKAEREYKRIQLQMGSLDINGQPMSGNIFENIHINNAAAVAAAQHQTGVGSRALNYVAGGAFTGKKLFYQFNQHHQQQQLPSFPPSPVTDISSLTGSNPLAYNQHVVKLSSNGTIINSTAQQQQKQQHHIYNSATTNSNNSSQSSPDSTRNSTHLFNNHASQHQQLINNNSNHDKSNLLNMSNGGGGSQVNARNFNWTQEAPSTIVPYAVIEACNLTLEGKNAIKEYV